jgi:succinyl-CoA synthetase beta subunit
LQGTNASEAKSIIDKSGLKVYSAVSFNEAAEKVKDAISGTL